MKSAWLQNLQVLRKFKLHTSYVATEYFSELSNKVTSYFAPQYLRMHLNSVNILFCRMFLCLFAGGQPQQLPKGLGTEGSNTSQNQVAYSDKRYSLVETGIQFKTYK